MAISLPNHPQLRGNYAPINFEASYNDLVIEGRVPPGLSGSLYRIGPNPKFVTGAYHWFFGTGMVHAFHVENGRVDYINRWVRTPKFEHETELGHGLNLEMSINPETGQVESPRRNGVANTHIVTHGEHLLALEEGSHPFSIEPTLRTRYSFLAPYVCHAMHALALVRSHPMRRMRVSCGSRCS